MLRSLLIVGVLPFLHPTAAVPQYVGTRHGFWLSAASGYGTAVPSCDTCGTLSQVGGLDLRIDLGGTLGPHWRLGAGVDAWRRWSSTGPVRVVTTLTPSLYYYPRVHRAFFIAGGIGLSEYRLQSGLQGATSWGGTLGIGWTVPASRRLWFTPRATYVYAAPRTLRSLGGALVASGWTQSVLSADVEVVLHQPDNR